MSDRFWRIVAAVALGIFLWNTALLWRGLELRDRLCAELARVHEGRGGVSREEARDPQGCERLLRWAESQRRTD